ncbi:hypothetical protein SAMN05444279_11363 [Ruegeria intermedia]|uniref:Uncharacterized protein n=1 Tax=Ruegeria intermedia TaxID=996115 RepID=A0A1M4XYW5_9RHOB|nr:hypothetical protein SAMN05444279_11363 [Ruegeria intermedia]
MCRKYAFPIGNVAIVCSRSWRAGYFGSMTERYLLHSAPDSAALVIRLALEVMGLPNRTAPTHANPTEGSAT